MGAASIEGITFDLKRLFGEATYCIEYYQREYAWSAEDVRTLVSDLFAAFDRLAREGRLHERDADDFFLGPFVYIQQSPHMRFLVDGQQRFTTLHLLFLHLYQSARAWGFRDVVSKLDRVITDFGRGNRPQFRLDIEERQDALEALYRERPYEVTAGASLSVRNLHERSQQIGDLLEEHLEAEHCQAFVDWLLSKVIMVGIRAPSRDSGFRIFESMNDRGARLTPVDLVKSYLLSNVRTGEEKLNEAWRRMLAELTGVRGDTDAPRRFLKSALLARYATVGENETSDSEDIDAALNIWIRKNSKRIGLRQPDDYFRFVEDLIRLAEHHRTFLHASKQPYHQHGLSALFYNEANGLTNQMALILAPIQPHDTDTQAKTKAALVANYLDRLYVERVLNDDPVQAKDFQPDIHRLVPQLRTCATPDDVSELLSAQLPDNSFEQVATFGMRGNNKAQVRYLLARLTAYVETETGKPDLIADYLSRERTWQIEHLYANHPERHTHETPSAVTFRAWRARLGVLVLLRQPDNASYNDLPLDVKRRRYARENALAAILAPEHRKNNPTLKGFVARHGIESHFREFGNETIQQIVEIRGELYRRLCTHIWNPQRLGFHPKEQTTNTPASTPHVPPAADARRGALRTDLARLMRAGVLPPGTRIDADHRGIRYTATVDAEGFVTLDSGDRYGSADEAGKVVCGTRRCAGMAFWHITPAQGPRCSLRDVRAQAQRDGVLTGIRRT
ncbi:GmrSD restriction endonuclease domain-containing protein [Streptomyces sp. NPDC001970]